MTAGVAERMQVRVMVQDVWDTFTLDVPASATVAELKRLALTHARVVRDPGGYLVKFRGAEILDETRTLGEVGIFPRAALIVMPRRRRPVR